MSRLIGPLACSPVWRNAAGKPVIGAIHRDMIWLKSLYAPPQFRMSRPISSSEHLSAAKRSCFAHAQSAAWPGKTCRNPHIIPHKPRSPIYPALPKPNQADAHHAPPLRPTHICCCSCSPSLRHRCLRRPGSLTLPGPKQRGRPTLTYRAPAQRLPLRAARLCGALGRLLQNRAR